MLLALPATVRPRPALVLAALLTGLVAACGPENTYQPPPPSPVTVAPPLKQPVTSYLELTGNTQATQSVDLTARVSGFLKEIRAKDGSDVKKGDVLFVIEQDQYKAQLALSQATVQQEQATLNGFQLELNRQKALVVDKNAAQATVDKIQAQYDATKAALAGAQAQVTMAEINLGYTEVTAPFDGRLSRHLVDAGNLVGQGSPTTLATVEQITPLYVYFSISETDVLRIREMLRKQGIEKVDFSTVPMEVGLRDAQSYPFKGTLDYVAPGVNPSTGTMEARGILPNEDLVLLPGLFVRLRVPVLTRDDVLLVPQAAIGSSQAGSYVMVLGADNKVQQRMVRTGQTVGRLQVIESGLEAGDKVVVDGLMRALPGATVAPRTVTLNQDGTIPADTASTTK